MENPGKSEEPWLCNVLSSLIGQDIPRLLGIPQQRFTRDLSYLERRLAAEGESFITKTLPAVCVRFDAAIQGHVPLVCPEFKKRGRTALPAFLSALHRRVFKDDGWLRDNPCVTSIRLIRQVLLYAKKIKRGISDEMVQQATEDFIEVDRALPGSEADFSPLARRLVHGARLIAEEIFRDVDNPAKALPKHGPGAVSDASGADDKRSALRGIRYTSLERVFRPMQWFFSLAEVAYDAAKHRDWIHDESQTAEASGLDGLLYRWTVEYGLSTLKFVPKTVTSVRVIGFEPAAYMYCQQAIKRLMVRHLERNRITRGHVNFADQTINQRLTAEWSTRDTLDMSKASDRNSFALVRGVLGTTRLWPWLEACRTPGTILPDGRTLMYKKFAPMGSATCFPTQAVVYYCLCIAALVLAGMPIAIARRNVYVYGDDLVVPHGYFPWLDKAFQSVGLKFNADKCCTHGKFRESCGMDAFDGVCVTPTRLRTVTMDTPAEILAIVAHAHELHKAGYWAALDAYMSKWRPSLDRAGFRFPVCSDFPPIVTWPTCQEKPIRCAHKDGIRTVNGWCYVPEKTETSQGCEGAYLLESLIQRGPVGTMSHKTGLRGLDVKYRGSLQRRRRVYTHATCKWLPNRQPDPEHVYLDQHLARWRLE